ncbi:cytochrome b-245 chaperone 1-like [Branchiostoma floridae x Branchiostoma japonicum]
MVYMKIKKKTPLILYLKRSPGIRSWSLLVGFVAVGVGAAYFSGDHILWSLFYITACLVVGVSCMEDWEECIFDKMTGKVTVKKFSLMQAILRPKQEQREIVADIYNIVSVEVEQETFRYLGTGSHVVLSFQSGYSIPMTEVSTLGDNRDHHRIASEVRSFLNLDDTHRFSTMDSDSEQEDSSLPGDGAMTGDDDFINSSESDLGSDYDGDSISGEDTSATDLSDYEGASHSDGSSESEEYVVRKPGHPV